MIDSLIKLNESVEEYAATFPADKLEQRRNAFFEKNGEVFHDDVFFEQRIRFFRYDLKFGEFAGTKSLHTDAGDLKLFHSIFRVRFIWGKFARVQDVLDKNSFWIKDGSVEKSRKKPFLGFSRGDLFQGFLLEDGEYFSMTEAVFLHPPLAHAHIFKMIRSASNEWDQDSSKKLTFLQRLSRIQLLSQRQQTTRAEVFYSPSGAFGTVRDKAL